jgi:hypothetical protein
MEKVVGKAVGLAALQPRHCHSHLLHAMQTMAGVRRFLARVAGCHAPLRYLGRLEVGEDGGKIAEEQAQAGQ